MNNVEVINHYRIELKPLSDDMGGGYEAFYPQLARSVVGHGATLEEALNDLQDMVPDFLEALAETGQCLAPPEAPRNADDYSGKFNVRVAKMLHHKLVRLAEEQGVSLNSLVQTALMAAATALDAGHEFGAINPHQSRIVKDYEMQV